jgi:hypothetical protein
MECNFFEQWYNIQKMINERFIFFGIFLHLLGSIPYLVSTFKGKTKPNRITWFFWFFAPLTAFFAEIQKSVGLQVWMTFSVGFIPLLIFLTSFFNKNSYWKLSKIDYFYGGIALIGILLWQITGEGNIAILFCIISDASASLPTVIKSYKNSETENSTIYFFSMLNAFITILTIEIWNFAYWGYPIYIFINSLIIFILVKFKIGNRFKANSKSSS